MFKRIGAAFAVAAMLAACSASQISSAGSQISNVVAAFKADVTAGEQLVSQAVSSAATTAVDLGKAACSGASMMDGLYQGVATFSADVAATKPTEAIAMKGVNAACTVIDNPQSTQNDVQTAAAAALSGYQAVKGALTATPTGASALAAASAPAKPAGT